jgi:hypothetical protein
MSVGNLPSVRLAFDELAVFEAGAGADEGGELGRR